MNRWSRRLFSTKSDNFVNTGCRLLDYTTPATHASISRPSKLLQSRFGMRYENRGKYDEQAELATIATYLHRKFKPINQVPPVWSRLKHRLNLPAETPFGHVHDAPHAPPRPHIDAWVDCIEKPTLSAALEVMSKHPQIPWPVFVCLFTFARHGRTAMEVYNAVRQFQLLLPTLPSHVQPEVTVLVLKLAQSQLVDLVPTIIQTFLSTTPVLTSSMLNEFLWQIARYGKRWSSADTPLLAEAQDLLVRAAGTELVDAKGVFALAYVTHFTKPQLARQFMETMKFAVHSRTPTASSREFAYTNGPAVIDLLTSESGESALAVLERTTTHKPAMWSCAAVYLSRNQLLTADTASRLWSTALRTPDTRITALLTELVINSLPSFQTKQKVLAQALAAGLKLTTKLVGKMAKVSTKHDLDMFEHEYADYLHVAEVQQQVLSAQSRCDPQNMWATYTKLRHNKSGAPSREVLRALCRAAWDPHLVWDGMYAAQRALAEFKMHVRGAAAPVSDLLRVFPDEQLIHAYVVMAGRSGYTSELIPFLSWMEDLGIEPTKRVLLALIHYSPQGPALLKLGQKTQPPSSQWPTEEEYEVYRKML